MREMSLTISILPDHLAVCRLDRDAELPPWALQRAFFSITRAADELSVVCSERAVPDGVICERGWRAFKIEGPLAFDLTGVLLSVATPLADAGISIFAVSTYDTDYILVKAQHMEAAQAALRTYGHHLQV
jgi:hypothetical protein